AVRVGRGCSRVVCWTTFLCRWSVEIEVVWWSLGRLWLSFDHGCSRRAGLFPGRLLDNFSLPVVG
ncbi:hypothetical protein, partial [Dactylosporangium sp. NPDC000521]|uniref:hypothetical protein n=1 Tax=Dactylosporangium sp. NPDC000521 TaxID=3363975 RepID=UPI00369980C7